MNQIKKTAKAHEEFFRCERPTLKNKTSKSRAELNMKTVRPKTALNQTAAKNFSLVTGSVARGRLLFFGWSLVTSL